MKKILLSIFGIITLGLINFSSANYTIEGTYRNFRNSGTFFGFLTIPTPTNSSNYNFSVNCSFTRNDSNYSLPTYARLFFYYSNGIYGNQDFNISNSSLSFNTTSITNFGNAFALTIPSGFFDFDYSCEIVGDLQNNIKCPVCDECQTCDYSSYESQIDSLTSSLSGCSSSYNQCIVDYGNCSSSLNYCYYDLGNCRAGVCSGDISTNLFINNIQYPINSNLFVNVPTEFDYVYSMTGNDSTIDIEYKVDSEYIAGIIENQNTLPNNVDFNNIITYLLPLFVPGLVLILFIYFVFRFIKKIF